MATKKAKSPEPERSSWAVVKGLLGAIAELERQQDGEKLESRTQFERTEQQNATSELARSPLMVALVWIALGLGALAFAVSWWWG